MSSSLEAPLYRLFVGVDIAAKTASVVTLMPETSLSRAITSDQSEAGFATLQARLQATTIAPADTMIVLEATGSYWNSLATSLYQAGYGVSVINPMQAHHFAKALLKRAKTTPLMRRPWRSWPASSSHHAGVHRPMSSTSLWCESH